MLMSRCVSGDGYRYIFRILPAVNTFRVGKMEVKHEYENVVSSKATFLQELKRFQFQILNMQRRNANETSWKLSEEAAL